MKIKEFKLERYFAKYEFTAKYLFSSSDCDGYALSEVLAHATPEELKMWDQLALGYTESAGHPALRSSILQHYALSDIDRVVVASPGELNFIAMNVLLEPRDHVIVVGPCYQSLSEVICAIGADLSYWLPTADTWQYQLEALKKLIRPDTRMIVINFPHNPTGAYLTSTVLDQLVEVARENDLWLFSDEMYHKLVIDASEELRPVADLYERGISLWGTSKSFGMAGLRIGWLVCQDQSFIAHVVSYKDYLSICNNAPGEVLTIVALNHSQVFIEPNIEKIKRNVALFSAFAAKQDLFASFQPPQAGSTAFVPLNISGTSQEFSDQLVKKHGIMTIPAEMFQYPGTYIRVGFGRDNFPEALDRLGNTL